MRTIIALIALLTIGCGPQIKGTISIDGVPAPNEALSMSSFGSANRTLVTNSFGDYSVTVADDWTGTITHTLYDASIQYVAVQQNQLNQDWNIAQQCVSISGYVRDAEGLPIEEVTMRAQGTNGIIINDNTVLTNELGFYSIDVPTGVIITVVNYTPPPP